jgi:hypothetical protein
MLFEHRPESLKPDLSSKALSGDSRFLVEVALSDRRV